MLKRSVLSGLLALAGCEYSDPVGVIGDVEPPVDLIYTVEPSGTPGEPAGVVLRWSTEPGAVAEGWNVYGRSSMSDPFALLATTSSMSFHDDGIPELQYQVTAFADGGESGPSNTVTVDERLALEQPASLVSVSLDQGVALFWADNAYESEPEGFGHYRIYTTSYDIDQDECGADWTLEGTTVAPEFKAAALANGVPRCFAVSAISIEGFESLWSPIRADTPRPDARNVAISTRQAADPTAGFRFWRDTDTDGTVDPGELGRVGSGAATDADFVVERDPTGRILIVPVRAGTMVTQYGTGPVGDLTDIDLAPVSGYARTPLEARPGFGFVFQMDGGDQFFRYGAIRATHVGTTLIIVDWAYQTDPGNPELVVSGRAGAVDMR
jgi:hypothetical protein